MAAVQIEKEHESACYISLDWHFLVLSILYKTLYPKTHSTRDKCNFSTKNVPFRLVMQSGLFLSQVAAVQTVILVKDHLRTVHLQVCLQTFFIVKMQTSHSSHGRSCCKS